MTTNAILLLRPSQNNTKKEDAANEFFSQLAEILKGKKLTLSAELVIYNKFLWFFLICPKNIKNIIKGQWHSHYPNAEIDEIKDYTEKLFFNYEYKCFAGCEFYYEEPELLPIKTYKDLEKNPLISLAGIASSFRSDETGFIQLVLEPPKKENLWDKFWKKTRESNRKKLLEKKGESGNYLLLEEKKEEQSYFKTTIRFLNMGTDLERAQLNLSSSVTIYKKGLERTKIQKLKEGRFRTDNKFLQDYKTRILGRWKMRFSTEEIATFFHLPYRAEEISQVVQIKSKKAPAPHNLPEPDENKNLAVFGETNFQNEKTIFGIKTEDRRRHLYIVGKTGVGKSKLIELLILSDLKAGRGIILVDPHGDLAKETLQLIPSERQQDVVYFNPTDSQYPIGFNPMEGIGSFEFKQNIVSGFISIFKKLFGLNWNERFEHVLRYTTLALLDYPAASVLGIPRMLTDNLFRQEVISYISDPLVKKFWTTEFMTWNEQYANEAIVPIINKVGQFVANPVIRNIVGQAKTGFSLDEILNKEKIFIANLSIGQLGEENSALLGSMLVTKIWQTAMTRASIPEEERKDAFMYVDEFQNFATTAFANILSESRKYRLNLTMAHQYIQQLPNEVRSAVMGNVGNIISFRVGGEDALIFAKEFEPVFTPNDFINLDVRDFYIKMSINGQTSNPFSARSITLLQPAEDKSQEIIELSRKKWAKTKKEAEEEIDRWEKEETQGKKKGEEKVVVEEIFFPEPII